MQKSGYLSTKEDDIRIEYAVKVSGSRYIYLRFKPDLKLEVILPFFCSKNAEEIVNEKSSWIIKKYKELLERKKVFNGEQLMIDGKYYHLISIPSDYDEVELKENEVIVRIRKQNLIPLIKSYMKCRTQRYLEKYLLHHARKLHTEFAGFYVKDLSKWGYCSKKNQLSFSLQLSALPMILREYIVLHELLHTFEFNHSKRFHRLLDRYIPDHKERERALSQIVPIKRGKQNRT